MKKANCIAAGTIAAGLVASLLILHDNRIKSRENETLAQQQENQLAELAAQNQQLSNSVTQLKISAQNKTNDPLPNDQAVEAAQLRAKIAALQQQTNSLAKEIAASRRMAGAQLFSQGDFDLMDHNNETGMSMAGGPRAEGKLNDARALTAALRKYADDHQGEFPSVLDATTPYLPTPLTTNSPPWANAPLSGTNDFEIVYQGSQTDLSGIPPRRVALIRERQPYLAPDGKWARVYGYADGAASIVESDDNFQAWEAQHIIPSPNGWR